MEIPLSELIRLAQDGDEQARNRLMERILPNLRAYIRLQCGPRLRAREASSDLVQEVCIAILRGLRSFSFRDEDGFRAWLFRVAEQRIIDRIRHERRDKRDIEREVELQERSVTDDVAGLYRDLWSPSRILRSQEAVERIESAFDRIAPRYRQVIVMPRMVGLSFEAIGEELGVSPHYARTLLSRALAQLLRAIDEQDVSHDIE